MKKRISRLVGPLSETGKTHLLMMLTASLDEYSAAKRRLRLREYELIEAEARLNAAVERLKQSAIEEAFSDCGKEPPA